MEKELYHLKDKENLILDFNFPEKSFKRKSLGLEKQIEQSVNKLSGGQMQRVAVARSLTNKPKLILADEPTANLDEENSNNVLEIMRKVCRDENATVIIATHDEGVLPYCDRIVTLKDGMIQSDRQEFQKSS